MDVYEFVSKARLEKCHDAWRASILQEQSDPKETISFHSGVVLEEEGYKYKIIEDGKIIREKFNRADHQIPGKIGDMAKKLLWICPTPGVPQNLVDYRDIIYFADVLDSKKGPDIEKALYLLYAENNDKDSFNILASVLKKKYALITYFFFLKDSKQYQVVRPNNFAERFSMLGANPKYALNCSWENYLNYIQVLKEVQCFLGKRYSDITLTDAHSFVWMLWKLSSK